MRDSKKPSAEFWNGGSRSLWEIQRSRVLSSGMVDQEVCNTAFKSMCEPCEQTELGHNKGGSYGT